MNVLGYYLIIKSQDQMIVIKTWEMKFVILKRKKKRTEYKNKDNEERGGGRGTGG